MTIKERKALEKNEMREAILAAANKLFLTEGYEKTSIRGIAEQIAYSPATIYQYFEDKDDIFLTIHIRAFDELLNLLKTADSVKNPLERLEALGKIYIAFALENPELYDLMFCMHAPMASLHAKKKEWNCGFETYDYLKNTISECIKQKLIRSTNIDLITISAWGHLHGLLSLHIHERYQMLENVDIQQVIYASVHNLVEMLKA